MALEPITKYQKYVKSKCYVVGCLLKGGSPDVKVVARQQQVYPSKSHFSACWPPINGRSKFNLVIFLRLLNNLPTPLNILFVK